MHFDEKLTTIVVASVTPKMKGANTRKGTYKQGKESYCQFCGLSTGHRQCGKGGGKME